MNQIEIYQTADHQTQVDVTFDKDTVWLTQKQIAELFGRDRVAITQHIGNIFKENELDKKSVCKDFLHTGENGKSNCQGLLNSSATNWFLSLVQTFEYQKNMSEIIIYQTLDNQTQVEVKFEEDTVWLTQKQIAEIFQTTPQNITLHLKKVSGEAEIDQDSTCKEYLQVQKEGKRNVLRKQIYYNLDAILSVGYRINSKRGTQFRQWATQRLKDHLVKGYTINQKRLEQLQKVVEVIEQSGKAETLHLSEAKGLLDILSHHTKSFVLLHQYDSSDLKTEKLNENIPYEIQYDEAKNAITQLREQLIKNKEATSLFGNEKDFGFKSSLQSIVQTFDGQYLYPSIEEQAAHLLYFIIKNHSFSDGNKRIGAFLFVWFLEKNKHRFKKNGEVKINDNGLVALALLVTQSNPDDKELMIKLIINLINSR